MEIKTRIAANGKKEIFDPVRRRYVICTPEEEVRQTYLLFLINVLNVPKIVISVEKEIRYNQLQRRYDIVVFSKGECLLIVECKAPTIKLSQETLYQIATYNAVLQAKYIVLFNGKQEMILGKSSNDYLPCERLPDYEKMG